MRDEKKMCGSWSYTNPILAHDPLPWGYTDMASTPASAPIHMLCSCDFLLSVGSTVHCSRCFVGLLRLTSCHVHWQVGERHFKLPREKRREALQKAVRRSREKEWYLSSPLLPSSGGKRPGRVSCCKCAAQSPRPVIDFVVFLFCKNRRVEEFLARHCVRHL